MKDFAAFSAVLIAAWAVLSSVFGIGFIGYFGLGAVKYFTLLDIQYNTFSYTVFLIPLMLFLGINLIQFIHPVPDRDGAIRPLIMHSQSAARRTLRIVLLIAFSGLWVGMVAWPWFWPDIRMSFPENSLLRDFVFIDPVFSVVMFTSIIMFSISWSTNAIPRWYRAARGISFFIITSAFLYIAGDTLASLKTIGTFGSEQVRLESGKVAKVIFVGAEFSILSNETGQFLGRTSDITFVELRQNF